MAKAKPQPRKRPRPADLAVITDAMLAHAALTCAARCGWAELTLALVATFLKMPLADLERRVSNRNAFVPLIAQTIDAQAVADAVNATGSPHDQLFDVLMARFDALQPHRAVILGMEKAARREPGLARALVCATRASMTRLAGTLNLTPTPPVLILRLGVTAVYGAAYIAWRRDDTADLARTMAALDRALRWAGRLAERLLS